MMIKTPLLAIDVPPEALVREHDQGKTWLSYNSGEYLVQDNLPPGRRPDPAGQCAFAKALDDMSE